MGLRQSLKNLILGEPDNNSWGNNAATLANPVPEPTRAPMVLGFAGTPNSPATVNPLTANDSTLTSALTGAKRLTGGRLSQDTEGQHFGTYRVVLPPNSPESDWRLGKLDDETLSRVPANRIMELMVDLSPEVSKALWDFLRFCNPGFTFVAYRKSPESPDPTATKAIQAFMDLLEDRYGSFDVVIGRLFFGAWLRGAFLSELVLDESARNPIDFAVPDPGSIRFIRYNDPLRGWVNILAQFQLGGYVILDRPTIRYIPIDPFPASPYGRPLISPALFSTMFLLGLLHDLRRVISQQGYPRLDLVVDLEAIQKSLPTDHQNDPKIMQAWVDQTIKDIQTFYANLQPEDAFVHTSAVEVKNPVGALNQRALGGASDLIKFVERMAMRSLKTMPLLMGITEGVSEANATRQWEIHVASIKALQHYCETMLESLFNVVLQAQGISGRVQFRFAELRASEALRDAQTDTLKINNAMQRYVNGWISQDEAAFQGAAKAKSDEKEPRAWPNTAVFEGQMVTSAMQNSQTPEPKANQSPGGNSNDQGGDKKPKGKTDPKKQNTDKPSQNKQVTPTIVPGFAKQVDQLIGSANS